MRMTRNTSEHPCTSENASNNSRTFQIHSKLIRTSLNTSEHLRKPLKVGEYLKTFSNLSEPIRKPLEHTRTSKNASEIWGILYCYGVFWGSLMASRWFWSVSEVFSDVMVYSGVLVGIVISIDLFWKVTEGSEAFLDIVVCSGEFWGILRQSLEFWADPKSFW